MLRSVLIIISMMGICSLSYADSVLNNKPDIDSNPYKNSVDEIAKMGVLKQSEKAVIDAGKVSEEIRASMNSSGIADERMQKDRNEVMGFLGLNKAQYNIFIFISFSMSDEMIKAYVREAIWTGAIVVVRGISNDDTLKTFIFKKLKPLVGKKGGTATIQIDPRLYDVFKIDAVPTIVITKKGSMDLCQTVNEKITINKQVYPFPKCMPLNESEYLKISGAVSLSWALEQFIEAGSEEAAIALDVLKKNVGKSDKVQVGFSGDWDSIYTPKQERKIMENLKKKGAVYQTPSGISVGVPGLEDEENDIREIK